MEFQNVHLLFADLPDTGPEISGGQPRYNIGDRVNVTCASRRSLPAAQLAWYINGEKADREFLTYHPEETDYEGLRTSKLGLSFKVRNLQLKFRESYVFPLSFPSGERTCQVGSGRRRMGRVLERRQGFFFGWKRRRRGGRIPIFLSSASVSFSLLLLYFR